MRRIVLIVFGVTFLSFGFAQLDKFGVDEKYRVPEGIPVGTKAPVIQTVSVSGDSIDSEKALLSKPIVILFYRGQWCPVCSRYLSNISDSLSLIEEKATVWVIGPETEANAKNMSEQQHETFTLIADSSLFIQQAFDVVFTVTDKYDQKIKTFLKTDIAENNGQEDALLPVPATYIIGQDGTILYRHFDFNYKIRASAKEILEALE